MVEICLGYDLMWVSLDQADLINDRDLFKARPWLFVVWFGVDEPKLGL